MNYQFIFTVEISNVVSSFILVYNVLYNNFEYLDQRRFLSRLRERMEVIFSFFWNLSLICHLWRAAFEKEIIVIWKNRRCPRQTSLVDPRTRKQKGNDAFKFLTCEEISADKYSRSTATDRFLNTNDPSETVSPEWLSARNNRSEFTALGAVYVTR